MMHSNEHQSPRSLLTIQAVAKRLSLSERTVRSLIAMGQLSVVRVSPRRVAVLPADLDAFVAQRRTQAIR